MFQSLVHSVSVDSDLYTLRDCPPELRSIHTDSPPRLRSMHHRDSLSPHFEKVDAVFKILFSLFHTDSRSCNRRKLRYQLDHAGISSGREGGCCFKLLFVVSSTQIYFHVISINSDGPSFSTGREGRSIRRFKMLFGLLDTDCHSCNRHKLGHQLIQAVLFL